VYLHRKGRAPGAFCGRRKNGGWYRRRRSPFFSPPRESKDAGLGVPENPSDRRPGTEAREAVCVMESSIWTHPEIMPRFFIAGTCENPRPSRVSRDQERKSTHSIWRRGNLLNHPMFTNPASGLGSFTGSSPKPSASFGKITDIINTGATGTGAPRRVEFMMRLEF